MKVKFVPQNVEFEIKPGQSVMHLAQDHGLYIKSVCKGVPSCAECRVRVVEGEHNVLPPGAEELALIGTGHFIDRRRLSCQLKCFGDIVVDMSEQIAKEQGLIGGRKSKTKAIKDDRIEDAYAIRASSADDSAEGDGSEAEALPEQQRERGSQRQISDKAQGRRSDPRGDQRSGGAQRTEGKAAQGERRNQRQRQNQNPAQPQASPAGDSQQPRSGRRRRRRGRGGQGGGGSSPQGES
jgi:ferredoxin